MLGFLGATRHAMKSLTRWIRPNLLVQQQRFPVRRCGCKPPPPPKTMEKILIANRSEVAIRVARACNEMGIKSVGIYSEQDKFSAHRTKVDQAFLVGKGMPPVAAYLNIPEIICIAKNNNVDAIHPGYGFLSEREDFAKAVIGAGLEFIGPAPNVLKTLGDKVLARDAALKADVPIIPGTTEPVTDVDKVKEFCDEVEFPVILKAAFGGGGRGMRMVANKDAIEENFKRAQSEALASFGKDDMLVEKYIDRPRHIEVQILGDKYGDVVHLYERDCSMQRRYQKVIQIAPAQDMSVSVRDAITETSVRLAKSLGYSNAGTVEFLLDKDDNFYFIEVNPRLQVEHTLSEEITGIDVVQSQIKIAQGKSLTELGLCQEKITPQGCAIQCHLRTEDPKRNFQPSTGRLDVFTDPASIGIRVDSSCPYPGLQISPDYDSLLAKIIVHTATYKSSCEKMRRALEETQVSGVTTNLPFLLNVFDDKKFLSGEALETNFIDDNPQLLERNSYQTCRDMKILRFIGETLVNGPMTPLYVNVKPVNVDPAIDRTVSKFETSCADFVSDMNERSKIRTDTDEKYLIKKPQANGYRKLLQVMGAGEFVNSVRKLKHILLTDTTFRDAHQSLLATRVRTYDLKKVSPFVANRFNNLYSLEMWGGAVSHTCLKFLKECPWERLAELRELIPNIPFQMILRGNSLVGYSNYSPAEVGAFCRLASQAGIDIFRVFDPLNSVPNLVKGMDAVQQVTGGSTIVEATICYAGDLTDPIKTKYSLNYYEDLAKQLVESGAQVLCLKDMAGLLKPTAAKLLIGSFREKYPNILIHVHTHDMAGTGVATTLACVKAGADIVDVAADSMSGICSQPAMGTIVSCLENTDKRCGIDLHDVCDYSSYWRKVRELYAPFECTDLKAASSEAYLYEIPGGQYTNLKFRTMSFGLDFEDVKRAYSTANFLLGDIIKCTPSSKVVADLAIFMTQEKLSYRDVMENADKIIFPKSVTEFFQGSIGEPYQGFPKKLQEKVLDSLKDHALERKAEFDPIMACDYREDEPFKMNKLIFPKATKKFMKFRDEFGPVDKLPTRIFLNGPNIGEEFSCEFKTGDTAYVTTLSISEHLNDHGERTVFFLYNGQLRSVLILDKNKAKKLKLRSKADSDTAGEIGAPMPGNIIEVKVKVGQQVKKNDVLIVMSVMKTETLIHASADGVVKEIFVEVGGQVAQNDLVVVLDVGEVKLK
ncbi:hypothetical protein M8J76_016779 [Diaphorina citri]|nr:hypothetical protein M8J75_009282 [Diaphorina citri]KAI5714421.1 hypothetical protein M8J76_016779 [Diaphorina citri]